MISAELVHGILRQRRSTSTELLKLSGLGNHFGNTSVVFFPTYDAGDLYDLRNFVL
jgi:hypothetical protein